jgi:aspartyl-tRNA(Asn)/glutamyl-tRNA(Gln) amidotransferase subunit A
VVTKLQDADAVIVGKTNMDEFAMGSSTENSAFGPTHNPWDLTRVPGGSSGGSAAAVASNQATVGIGSDTGGSVRQPAALTGIVGVKPTYGTVSRYGLVAFASSLDQIGPFARSVSDAALVHAAISGHDPRDGTSAPDSTKDLQAASLNRDLTGLRFGVVREMQGEGFAAPVLAEFTRVQEILKSLGASVQEVSLPHAEYGTPAYYLIAPSEASSNLARFDAMRYGLRVSPEPDATVEEVMSATRDAGFGAEVKRRIIIGTFALSTGYYEAFYAQAQKVRTLIARDYQTAFSSVDVIISPTSPTTAFKLGERVNDPLAMYAADLATLPVSLAGLPAMSLPIGLSKEDGLPIGMQLVAPAFQDELLYRAAAPIESALEEDWGEPLIAKRPPILVSSK